MWARKTRTALGRALPRRRRGDLPGPSGRDRDTSTATGAGSAELVEPDRKVLEKLVCPFSKMPLNYDRDARELISPVGVAFPITATGIPNMAPASARLLAAQEDDTEEEER